MLTVGVITATRNHPLLQECVRSIDNQTYPCKHYLVADGVVDYIEFGSMVSEYASDDRYVAYWPTKIKKDPINAGRIYAACPALINEDITMMLNEDDMYAPDHIESLVNMIESQNLDWAYSHRAIYSKEGKYLFDDNCEALGHDHEVFHVPGHNFAEACAMAMRTEAFVKCSPAFNVLSPYQDRMFYNTAVKNFPNFGSTKKATMLFRLGGNAQSVTKLFFELGNAEMAKRYPNGLPW